MGSKEKELTCVLHIPKPSLQITQKDEDENNNSSRKKKQQLNGATAMTTEAKY